MKSRVKFLALVVLAGLTPPSLAAPVPLDISGMRPVAHTLTFDPVGEVVIAWDTLQPMHAQTIEHGPDPNLLSKTGHIQSVNERHHKVQLGQTDLQSVSRYYYRVPFSDAVFSFDVPQTPEPSGDGEHTFAIASLDHKLYGPRLARMLQRYKSSYSTLWDLSCTTQSDRPDAVVDHESVLSFQTHSSTPSLSWYSHNKGGVHLVGMDHNVSRDNMKWLIKDLESVDRTVTPWVVVAGARQRLSGMQSSLLTEIFNTLDVDLLISLDGEAQFALSHALEHTNPSAKSFEYLPLNHQLEWARATAHNDTDLTVEYMSTDHDMGIDQFHLVKAPVPSPTTTQPAGSGTAGAGLSRRSEDPDDVYKNLLEDDELTAEKVSKMLAQDPSAATRVLNSDRPLSTHLLLLLTE